MIWILAVPGWCVIAVGAAVLIGKGIRLADPGQTDDDGLCELVQPECWSQAAIDEAFAQIIPQFATEAWWKQ